MRELLRQLISFGLVGLLNTTLCLALIFGLLAVGMAFVAANLLGYGLGLLVSFSVNRRLTFRSRGSSRSQLPRFLGVYGMAYALQLSFATALREQSHWSPGAATFAGSALFAVICFCGSRWLVFPALPRG